MAPKMSLPSGERRNAMRVRGSRPRTIVTVVALLIGSGALYLAGLGWSPPYLSIEEVAVVQQAVTLAETGRDDSGRWLPLFITDAATGEGGGPHDPMWVYADAALLEVAPFSEALMRAFSALVGVVDVGLMFLVGRRIFRRDTLAVAAALILALTPAHFLQSRIGSQQIGAVPFVLLWLLFLVQYLDTRRPRDLVWASAALGVGMYSYIAASVLLPCCFLATVVALARGVSAHHRANAAPALRRELGLAVLGFTLPLVPMLVWHLVHPERIGQLLDYYTHHGYNEDVRGSSVLSSHWVITRLDLWWNTLNPERLLFLGDGDVRYSTRQVGYLLLPVAVLMVIGAALGRQFLSPELRVITVIVLVLGPLPAILAGDVLIKRWLALLPFFAVLATAGVAVLLDARRALWRGVVVALAAAAVVQFTAFLRYYHGEYRAYANSYLNGNIHGVVREVLAATDDPACALIDRRIDVPAQWRLYARVAGRHDFAQSINAVDVESPDFLPPATCRRSAVVVLEDQLRDRPEVGRRLEAAGWQKTSIPEPEGKTMYWVYRHHGG
jgi:hypothetical protein